MLTIHSNTTPVTIKKEEQNEREMRETETKGTAESAYLVSQSAFPSGISYITQSFSVQ